MTTMPTFPILGTRLVSDFRGDYNDITDALLKAFLDTAEPSPMFAGMLWCDTSQSPKLMKQRNTANTAWINRWRLDESWGGLLSLLGGTMEGAIDMGGYGLTNIAVGSGNGAIRFSQVEGTYMRLDAGQDFTVIPKGPSQDPSQADELSRRAFVVSEARAGGTYTAQIVMPDAATASNHVMRKNEHDSSMSTHTHSGGAGMGPRINLTAVTTASAAGLSPRSNGSSDLVNDEPIALDHGSAGYSQVYSGSGAVGWTEFDCGPWTPTHAKAALLHLILVANDYGYLTCYFRRKGASTPGQPFANPINLETNFHWDSQMATTLWVGLDTNQKFEWRRTLTGGGGSINAQCLFVGYI